ncbi:hypothetical protein FRB94_008276 [Tulasnella sp. JGI-2019a]|nr:hypothetical protein FRB94_008276 [Tulasnella sp. JGI-2019a]KAG9004913.1 hypothetical protein FRB93_010092 [Tulasnella sp. JGI-2019a]KAG9027627.1 hypothetical protein FRB95_007561 [Tulasnella sp. JGI-2019a]
MEVDPKPAGGVDSMDDIQSTTALAVVDPNALPEEANETIYIQNLNEKVKLDVLKLTLERLFKAYGKVLNVTAHKNLRMRGQAFVSFESKEIAAKAVKEVKGFPLYHKPMQVSFAKTKSDAVVKTQEPDGMDAHVEARKKHKKHAKRHNPLAVRKRAQRTAAKAEGAAPSTAPKRPAVQMPDEYLPPNRVLFIQNLPVETITQEILQDLFGQHPNLMDIRTVPTKKDIAFVEYADEDSATVAKDALHNHRIDGETKIKITYARK